MDPLEDPPVRRRRESQRLVGKVGGEEAGERPDRQVLVDDDHDELGRSVAGVVRSASEERVGSTDGSQGIGELISQVAHGDPNEDRLVLFGQPGITGPTLAPELCEQLFALGHLTIVTGPGGRWIPVPESDGLWPEREPPGGQPKSPARRLTALWRPEGRFDLC